MTKNAKAGKAKAKPERKKREAKPKPTAEQLSDQQRQALLFSHRRKLKPLLAAEKEAKAAVSKAYNLAKEEGVTKKEILLAIQIETDEGLEKVKQETERTNRIARWLGVDKQLELFGSVDKATMAERHYEDGRRSALNDEPARPPEHLSQKDAQTWLDGHAAGRKTLNTERASGFKPLSDVVNNVVPINGNGEAEAPVPPIGTEPATHQIAH